jgi:hypothetical protein
VAQELGVSEDAVHQRLTRGRRLLQAQVLAFVEGALERTKPGPAFTLDVVAALPVLAAASKSAAVAHSTSQLLKGALKIMAWTKTKTAILAGVIALLGGTSSIVGYKVWQAHGMGESSSSGLSPTMMDQIYSIEADGTVRFQGNIEEINRTSQAAHTDNIGDIDTSWSLVDASGHSMKLKRRPDHGVLVTLNKAVPPGQKIFYTMTGSMGNMVKRNQSGNYMMEMTQIQGNEHDMHLVEVWRLPTGATLVTNSPAEFTPSTNEAGQIELRLDKVVPPNGRTPLVLGYRLASAAN